MSIKRPLAPKPLNKLDEYLLMNQPETWSSRTHLVAYYGLLFIIALAGLCFIIPNDPRDNTSVGYWIGFTSIISVIALIVWMIYLLRFNVFKRYGNITPLGRLQTFILYFISIAVIAFFTYVPPLVESARANIAYSDNEVVNDINSINTKICQLEYDSLQHKWNEDTVIVVNKKDINARPYTDKTIPATDTMVAVIHQPYQVMDTAELRTKLKVVDSSIKISDSLYVLAECPNYKFLRVYQYDLIGTKILTSPELFSNVIRNYKTPDKQKVKQELDALINKYNYNNSYYSYYYSEDYVSNNNPNASYRERLTERYNLNKIDRSIGNIMERKFRWREDEHSWQYRIIFYITLVLSLLIFIFRHSTVKTFFLSLLAGILLTIITGIFIAFSHGREENYVFGWYIFYTLLFAIVSLSVFKMQRRTALCGISINLFVLTVTFLPIVTVSYYYSIIRSDYYAYALRPFDYAAMYRNIMYAEIAGFILLVVLLPTLIHRLYRQWYALPEE